MNPADIIAQYTCRDMIDAMVQKPRPTTFLLDMLVGGRTEIHDTDIIEIDIVKGGQTMAAYVSRVSDPTLVGKDSYDTLIHAVPYIYEEIIFTSKDVKKRLPSQTVYQTGAANRLSVKIGQWLGNLEDRMIRREEYQVAEAIQTGKLVVQGDGVDYTVDFKMDPAHLVVNSGNSNWGSGSEDKLAQLSTWSRLCTDKGAPMPTIAIMDKLAGQDFIKDENVLKYLDNRRVKMGEIDIKVISGQRATYLGTISYIDLNIDIYTYSGSYTDDNKDQQFYMKDNTVVLTSTVADFRMHYGMIENMKDGDFEGTRFPDIDMDSRGKKGWISLESAPMFGLHQPDAVVSATTKTA